MDHIITAQTRNLIQAALLEDMPYGDITSENLGLDKKEGTGEIIAKQNLVLAGTPVVRTVFELLDPSMKFVFTEKDGKKLAPGDRIMEIHGKFISILKGERTALNFLQRLSGIATLTNEIVREVENLPVRITDTRKTTPLWRLLEKYAVRMGGGHNHRYSLSDAVMIKDNHISAVGGIEKAVTRLRACVPHTVTIEVEASTLDQVREALNAGADSIMLDNMDEQTIREAVQYVDGKAIIEASGGITKLSVRKIAETGVDIISLGALTHSAPSVDISLEILES